MALRPPRLLAAARGDRGAGEGRAASSYAAGVREGGFDGGHVDDGSLGPRFGSMAMAAHDAIFRLLSRADNG